MHTRLFVPGSLSVAVNSDRIDAESEVSGNRTNVPVRIRRALDIDDGDRLRWQLEGDGSVRVAVRHQRTGTFAEYDGYDGEETTDVTNEYDASESARCGR